MRKAQNIGRAELEILQYVQERRPVTVREVADHFARTKGHVRTTILNVMERLRKKGHLSRRKIDGVFHDQPCVAKAELLRTLVRDFVERTLGGSLTPFVAYMINDAKVSEEEFRELKQLVRTLGEQEKEKNA